MAVLCAMKKTGMKKMKQLKQAFVKRIPDKVGKHRNNRFYFIDTLMKALKERLDQIEHCQKLQLVLAMNAIIKCVFQQFLS